MTIGDIITNLKITCIQNNINYNDLLLCAIYGEYPIATLNADNPNIYNELFKQKRYLENDYELLWDLQPSLEEDEDHAFAVQHARDIYDVLLGRY